MTENSSGIVRVNKRANSYAVIDSFFLSDVRLSWKAKGLLAYLLSKPDNWRVYVSDLVKRSRDGRDSVYSALRELEEAGYIERRRIKDEKGRIAGIETVVYERPLLDDYKQIAGENEGGPHPDFPHPDFPDMDNPDMDLPTHNNININNTDLKMIELIDNNKRRDEILTTLASVLRQINLHDTVTLYEAYFEAIYAMLCRQFPDKLEPDIIRRAGYIYLSRTLDDRTLERKMNVYNPPGLFCRAYEDALAEYYADGWKKVKTDVNT